MFSDRGFENEFSNNLTVSIKLLKIRLKEKECTDWQENIVNSSKLRTYITFKGEIKTEPFVEDLLGFGCSISKKKENISCQGPLGVGRAYIFCHL